MTRTEEMKWLRSEMFRIRYAMQLSIRDEKNYEELKKELRDVKKKLALLKYQELVDEKEKENSYGKF